MGSRTSRTVQAHPRRPLDQASFKYEYHKIPLMFIQPNRILSRTRSKKGYFFIIDAFVAIMILSIGMYLVLSSYMAFAERDQTVLSSRSLVDFMSGVSIAEYDSEHKFEDIMGLSSPDRPNLIRRYDNSIAEQIGEFYFRELMSPYPDNPNGVPLHANPSKTLARDVVESIVPHQFEVEVLLNDHVSGQSILIYSRSDQPRFDEDDARLLVPHKTIIMGDFEDDETEHPILWGPYVLEVRVWQ